MFKHKYSCSECNRYVTIRRDQRPYDPFYKKLAAVHSELTPGQVNPGWDWIPAQVEGANKDCGGMLKYISTDSDDPVPAPQPQPSTAADVSREYCNNPGDHNTICAAVDINNPATRKKGVNAHGKQRAQLSHALQGILQAKVSRLEGWDVTNCAEIDAVDGLLQAGVARNDIRVHSRDQKGNPKPPCENCQGWLQPAEGALGMQVYKIRQ